MIPDQPVLPMECFEYAAIEYNLPLVILPAIFMQEQGLLGPPKPSSINKNGTADHGPMQINDNTIKDLAKYGVTKQIVQYDSCRAIIIAGWVLRYKINKAGGDFWKGVGHYNASNPVLARKYMLKVYKHAQKLLSKGWY